MSYDTGSYDTRSERAAQYAWELTGEPRDLTGGADAVNDERFGGRGSRCRVEGCRGTYRPQGRSDAGGSGAGYCAAHYRALLRFGHPLGQGFLTREALLEAAHAYCDEPSLESLTALATAAAQRGSVAGSRPLDADLMENVACTLRTVEARELEDAAYHFSEHDAEAPLASFNAALERLDRAARLFFRVCALGEVGSYHLIAPMVKAAARRERMAA